MRLIINFIFTSIIAVACATASEPCKVVRIIDGDTLLVRLNHDTIKIRIYGIDAPEVKQEYGTESAICLKNLLNNQNIAVDIKGTDIYGRTLAKLYTDSYDVGFQMVKYGAAWAYIRNTDDSYIDAMNMAKTNKLGLWGTPYPMNPKEFRKRNR